MALTRLVPLLTALGIAAAGCSSPGHTIGQAIPHWAGGEPSGAPARPGALPPYPAVHDLPESRDVKLITVEEQQKLEAELATLRSQAEAQATAVGQQRNADEATRQELERRMAAAKQRADAMQKQRERTEAERKKLEADTNAVRSRVQSRE
jgi:hypothetical protein